MGGDVIGRGPRQQILRMWRIWQPVALLALFAAFGGPRGWVPMFQVVIVVAATLPLVRGLRLVDAAQGSVHETAQLRRLLWLLSAPLYLVVVGLLFLR